MPWHDWEFWIVTVLAMIGLFILMRPFLPRRKGSANAACPNCASGEAAAKPRRATLTIESKPPQR
jgi:hypothetical protein